MAVHDHCVPAVAAGLGGAAEIGIPALEIAAACHLMRVPRSDRPEILAKVQRLGRLIAKYQQESPKRS